MFVSDQTEKSDKGEVSMPENANGGLRASLPRSPSDHLSNLSTGVDVSQIFSNNLCEPLGSDGGHPDQLYSFSTKYMDRPLNEIGESLQPADMWAGFLNQPPPAPFEHTEFSCSDFSPPDLVSPEAENHGMTMAWTKY
jgi:hypothetical protein